MSDNFLAELLQDMDCSELSYEEWLNVGMGLKQEGYSVDVWDTFSRYDSRYHEGECERKWNGFKRSDITGATITQIAKEHGWFESRKGKTYGWDDEWMVESDWESDGFNDLIRKPVIDRSFVEKKQCPKNEEVENWQNLQAIRFIETLFEPGERIAYTTEAFQDEKDSKWKPSGKGTSRTYEDIIKCLKSNTFDSVNDYSGVWVRSNPMDGKGVANENVTAYKYALIESDELSIDEQYTMLHELKLPIATIVHSGGKSLHALVKINAMSYREYQERVRKLYAYCERNGFKIDGQNKNPSRLTRFPGFHRGNKEQYLIDTNVGAESWDDWYQYIQEEQDDLPDILDFADIMESGLPELAPELISGILRQGHKMLLAGPSKAGKSFCLLQLTLAIANGSEWLGKKCEKGKVLYINLELDERSCYHRIADVAKSMDLEIPKGMISIWNLRGRQQSMQKLTPRLVRRIKDKEYAAVILDPIYKVTAGDENSAEAMGAFCNSLDTVCQETGASLIYCHHHSKGGQAHKSSMDRSSGSGVFARDADAIMDMLELEIKDGEQSEEHETAWRIEYNLREFAEPKPLNIYFRYPIHEIDINGNLEKARTMEARMAGQRGNETQKQEKLSKQEELLYQLDAGFFGDEPTLKEVSEAIGYSEKSIRRYLKDSDYEVKQVRSGGKFAESRIYEKE